MDITSRLQPSMSLGFQIKAMEGRNQVQRNVGLFSSLNLLPANGSLVNFTLELGPGSEWKSNPNETIAVVLVSAVEKVKIDAENIGGTFSAKMRTLIWESELKSLQITNEATASVRVAVSMITAPVVTP